MLQDSLPAVLDTPHTRPGILSFFESSRLTFFHYNLWTRPKALGSIALVHFTASSEAVRPLDWFVLC